MTDSLMTPELHRVDKRVKRIPPDVLHWLHTVRDYASNDEMVTGLAVTDGEIEFVLMTRPTWNRVSAVLNAPHRDRRRALFADMSGIDEGVANAD